MTEQIINGIRYVRVERADDFILFLPEEFEKIERRKGKEIRYWEPVFYSFRLPKIKNNGRGLEYWVSGSKMVLESCDGDEEEFFRKMKLMAFQ